ncbi:MAG: DeoR family transcriptional regulator, partial [Paludibacteraceae bacterium]|nr:DeoR family transcriptional regulator [Paludibacteraceae bacterium]
KKSLFWQEMKNLPLNERQIKIINRLWDGFEGKLNTSKYAKITKTSDATALRDIQDLVSKGILIKGEGSGRSAHYLLAAPFTAARH